MSYSLQGGGSGEREVRYGGGGGGGGGGGWVGTPSSRRSKACELVHGSMGAADSPPLSYSIPTPLTIVV